MIDKNRQVDFVANEVRQAAGSSRFSIFFSVVAKPRLSNKEATVEAAFEAAAIRAAAFSSFHEELRCFHGDRGFQCQQTKDSSSTQNFVRLSLVPLLAKHILFGK